MIIRREVGEKGQVVIPKDIRDMLGIRFGQEVIFEVVDNQVKLTSSSNPEKTIEDFLSGPKLKKRMSSKQLKEIMLEQYNEEIPRF
ncbi:MAG: AbrB/MazE/SpoVT family DNA-binding domain-containing protein [Nanoarchaeota archaeon]